MLLFVAAAALALLFGPPRTASPTPASPAATSPLVVNDVVDPWGQRKGDVGVTAPARPTPASGDEVVDPWARPVNAPPGPVTVLDAPVDPWAAPAVDPAAPSADRDGVLDPWNRGHDANAARAPHVLGRKDPNRPADLRDPWAKADGPAAAKPRVSLPPRLPPPVGVRDPWRERDVGGSSTSARDAAAPPAPKAARAVSPSRPRAEVADPWK